MKLYISGKITGDPGFREKFNEAKDFAAVGLQIMALVENHGEGA
jgi:hypothetical protein